MLWLFALIGLVLIVVIGLVVLGRETARLATAARSAVFDLAQAEEWIAERLPEEVQARVSHEDVRWVLMADVDLLESRSDPDATSSNGPESDDGVDDVVDPLPVVDPDDAVARILALADEAGRDLADEDVVAILDVRGEFLRAIGAVGGEADRVDGY